MSIQNDNPTNGEAALPFIDNDTAAFSHIPEHGFSLFLANRTKTIHFIRHAEGTHNEVNQAFGNDTPVTVGTPNAWDYMDARLTNKGIGQCIKVRDELLGDATKKPELIVVSPFTRTLQTAHIIFCGRGVPFLVHHLCRERWGKYTCDKRRPKTEIVEDMRPVYEETGDAIDFDSFGFETEEDSHWQEFREPDEECTARGIAMMEWLATRPENEIAVVTHSSWLKHLFRAFGQTIHESDKKALHRLSGNAELRSICLACHKGFYPPGSWIGDTDIFVPDHPSFRRGRWAATNTQISNIHEKVREESKQESK